jgi:membrane fusion protein, multidrug efflux system
MSRHRLVFVAFAVLLLHVSGNSLLAGAPAAGGAPVAAKEVGKTGEAAYVVLGSLVATTVRIMAPADGVVVEVCAKEGDEVKAGDVLVRLDDHREMAALQVAEIEAQSARKDLARLEMMQKAKTISDTEVEHAETAQVAAQTKLLLMREDVANMRIVAPFAGIMAGCEARPRQVVSRGAQLGRLVAAEALKVECVIPESLIPRVRKGQKATVAVSAYPDEAFEGEICFIAPEVDRATATLVVKVQLSKADRRLMPGMTARVAMEFGR